jgi:hypothetical protein
MFCRLIELNQKIINQTVSLGNKNFQHPRYLLGNTSSLHCEVVFKKLGIQDCIFSSMELIRSYNRQLVVGEKQGPPNGWKGFHHIENCGGKGIWLRTCTSYNAVLITSPNIFE